ncbi:MAG: gliding motility-associated C-terminal domain-containing protein [Roseivirga sp.]|nr:gliding motility-associated C-terminal domain-containing protein [Roseivirga sp.]
MKRQCTILTLLITLSICPAKAQGNLIIDEGTVLSIVEGSTFTLQNASLTNHGTIGASNSKLHLSADHNIKLKGNPFELSNLSIDVHGHEVKLTTSMEVKKELRLLAGILDLGSERLTLGEESGRISGENNENRITASDGGEIVKIAELINPNRSNPGNLGIELSCGQHLGRTEIRRGHLATALPSGMSVARHFSIRTETPVSEDINFRFYFLDAERNAPNQRHQLWKKSRNRWQAMKTEASSAPSDPFPLWLSGSDFELAQQYIVGPEHDIEETLSSIPSAFTPNADGVNDFFEIPWIQNHPEAEVSIYNRWGDLILKQTGYHRSPWNGTHNGRLLASSSFYYIIRLTTGKAPLKGKISIVR